MKTGKLDPKTRALHRREAKKETPAERTLLDILTKYWSTLTPDAQMRTHRALIRTVFNHLAERSVLREKLTKALLDYVRLTIRDRGAWRKARRAARA